MGRDKEIDRDREEIPEKAGLQRLKGKETCKAMNSERVLDTQKESLAEIQGYPAQ